MELYHGVGEALKAMIFTKKAKSRGFPLQEMANRIMSRRILLTCIQ